MRAYKAWSNDPALAVDDKDSLLLLIYAFLTLTTQLFSIKRPVFLSNNSLMCIVVQDCGSPIVVCPLISHSAVTCRNFGLGLFDDLKFGDNWWLVRKDRTTSPPNKASDVEIPYIEAKHFKSNT